MSRDQSAAEYVQRLPQDYHVSELPFGREHSSVKLLRIEAIRISAGSPTRFYDIGSILYTERLVVRRSNTRKRKTDTKAEPRGAYGCFEVKLCSRRQTRIAPLERYIEHLYVQSKTGVSNSTIDGKILKTMHFMGWCDDNGHEACLDDIESARKAFKEYLAYLDHQQKIYDKEKKIGFHNSTAVTYQNMIKEFLCTAFDVSNYVFVGGVRLITINRKLKNHTLAPDHEVVGKNLSLWTAIFRNLTEAVLAEKPFPFQLDLPSEKVWVIPTPHPFLTKEKLGRKTNMLYGFNRLTGTFSTAGELSAISGKELAYEQRRLNYSKRTMEAANIETRHERRRLLAQLAHSAFFMMFMMFAGTRTEIRFIKWCNEGGQIEPAESVGFKIIKARAHGKLCEYRVSRKFLKDFELFLKLREWMINGKDYDYLFCDFDNRGKLIQSRQTTAANFNKKIKNLIDDKFPIISPSKCRVTSSDFITNHYSVEVAATKLQNTPSTLRKHYANGNPLRASQQITNYFNTLKKKIESSRSLKKIEPIPTGNCREPGSPKVDDSSMASVTVDCSIPQHCLYCEHFSIHADEIDVRKLLSLEYVIKETKSLAGSVEEFEDVYGELIKRIENLLEAMEKIDSTHKTMIGRIRNEVFNDECLSIYWGNKLQQLVRLGVL